jgi:ferredoxin
MEGSSVTRLQEFPWVDEAVVSLQPATARHRPIARKRTDLYRLPWLHSLLESRWPQFLLRLVTLSGFILTLAAGLFGSRVGSHNFAIIFVWIAWWTALKLVFIPLGGRSWCSVCPIPLPGEWLQQGGVMSAGRKRFGLGLRWPKKLKGSWMQSGAFLVIGLFSAVTLTDPRLTGWVLMAVLLLAFGLSMVYEKRPFCTNICPIGGLSGMYAQAAPLEVRAIDKDICRKHELKSCYQACPWGIYPVALQNNSACAQCLECLRACPHDNLAINLRPFGADLARPRSTSRLDEALLALVMLGSVMAFAAVFTGPWGWLKSAAFAIGTPEWLAYSSGYLALNLLLLPAIFSLAVWLGNNRPNSLPTFKKSIARQAHSLIPLGLMAWIAFTISFALPKLNFIATVLNDPFGWGWRLLGITGKVPILDAASLSLAVQVILLLAGLYWSANIARKVSALDAPASRRSHPPVLLFHLVFTLIMLWLLAG